MEFPVDVLGATVGDTDADRATRLIARKELRQANVWVIDVFQNSVITLGKRFRSGNGRLFTRPSLHGGLAGSQLRGPGHEFLRR